MTNAKIKVSTATAETIRKKYRYWADRPLEEHTQLLGEAVGFECGVLFVLKELGLKIEGVNA